MYRALHQEDGGAEPGDVLHGTTPERDEPTGVRPLLSYPAILPDPAYLRSLLTATLNQSINHDLRYAFPNLFLFFSFLFGAVNGTFHFVASGHD